MISGDPGADTIAINTSLTIQPVIVNAGSGDDTIDIETNGRKSTATISPGEKWKDVEVKNVQLKSGRNAIRFKVITGQPDFDSFRFNY